MEHLNIISSWNQINPIETGVVLAAIPIIVTLIVVSYSAVQYVIIRKTEMYQRRFENYYQLIDWLVVDREQGVIELDNKIACVYELRNYKSYKDVSIRILEGLREEWVKIPEDKRLIDELDLSINALRRK